MRVTMKHMADCGYCARGVRSWFKLHDLDFHDFVQNGIEADALAGTGDVLVMRAVDLARSEVDGR